MTKARTYEIVAMRRSNRGRWIFTARPVNSEIAFECESDAMEDELFKHSQEPLWLNFKENRESTYETVDERISRRNHMKTEQFKQLQNICTLDGLCYSLNMVCEEYQRYGDELVDYELPEEIADAAENLQMHLRSFRATLKAYVIANKDTYIDKEESI